MPIAQDFKGTPYLASWGKRKLSRQEAEEKLAQEEAQQLADLEAQRLKLIDNVLLVTEKIDKLSEET